MLMVVTLPALGTEFVAATVDVVHATEGDFIAVGAPLLDLTVDFSAGIAYDCPAVSHFRIVMRDAGWLCRLPVSAGAPIAPQGVVALLGSTDDDDPAAVPTRAARVTLASILRQDGWWGTPV